MIKIPLYPDYSTVSMLLKIIDGMPVADFKSMWNTIWNLRGTPQNTVDWKDPDTWINDRLIDKDREIASKIWSDSRKTVNPRWIRGDQFLMNVYNLIDEKNGLYTQTEDGKTFSCSIENSVISRIDLEEGLIQILLQLSLIGKGKRADLMEDWIEYTKINSNLKQDTSIKSYLLYRLTNLIDRGYVKREGNTYAITARGINYLESVRQANPNPINNKETDLNYEVEKFITEQRKILKDFLARTTPYQFEHIIKDLLTAMGYEDVQVTSPTNDKGIDVTGISQNGITTVKEVIQVKRNTTSNITRPILDSLRGCLHRFDAFQGTIITLSDFAKGAKDAAFEKGAAPLTLINGEKLIDLLIQYEIGINRKRFVYYTIDENYFKEEDDDIE